MQNHFDPKNYNFFSPERQPLVEEMERVLIPEDSD